MGKGEKKAKVEEYSSSEEDIRKRKTSIEAASVDEDEEANEDLSLKLVQKSMLRTVNNDPRNHGVSEIVMNLKEEKKNKEKKKKKKSDEIEVPVDSLGNAKDKDKPETDEATEASTKGVETNPVDPSDNAVLRKLLRGPRYFDPPDNSWGACYNCGEEGHTTVNCTSAKRKKPCFVCGSFEHNAKQCSKGRDCFICKQQGHRAKDCPEKNSSKMCLKCGDPGHDMFSCRNDYYPDDLKEIQCYICAGFGHLCCGSYSDPGPREVSCYRCGLSGHTGLACTGQRRDRNDTMSANSCYKCGLEGHFARECANDVVSTNLCYKCGLDGHFARECTNSIMTGKRHREPSTPKRRSSKKNRDWKEFKSAPHDLGKTHKKKKSHHPEFTSAAKTKQRGGWIMEDPGYYYGSKTKAKNWKSPATPIDRRAKISSSNGDYASSSRSSKKPRKLSFNNSASNGSTKFYQHRFSASRFGSNNDGKGRNYNWW